MFDLFVRFPYLAAAVSFLVGLILMPFVLQFAKSRNMVVRPNKRTSHQGAVPNIGGVNIFLSLLVVFIPLVVSGNMKPSLFVGFCIIFVIGFIDDRLVLSAYWKIVGSVHFFSYISPIFVSHRFRVFWVYTSFIRY